MSSQYQSSNFSAYIMMATLEVRKLMFYRVDFWLKTVFSLIAQVLVAFFLWDAIYEYRGTAQIAGYSFEGMIIYYLIAAFMRQSLRGTDVGAISKDIYNGYLTKYMVYPCSFYWSKWISHLTYSCLYQLQLLLTLMLLCFVFTLPPDVSLGFWSVVAGFISAFLAIYLYFALSACIELLAFWFSSVWSVMILMDIVVSFLGGAQIPLSLFPEWAQFLLKLLPCYYLIFFPVETFLGHVGLLEWALGIILLGLWSMCFTFLSRRIWLRGTKDYSAVGI